MVVLGADVVPHRHARLQRCDSRTAAVNAEEKTSMIELRLELQPYYDDRDPRNTRRVQRGSAAARTGGWSSSSSHGDQREVALPGPALPRRSAALEEDTFEFGAVRFPEIEL